MTHPEGNLTTLGQHSTGLTTDSTREGDMISLGAVVQFVVTVLVVGLIFWLLWWLVGYINPPEPFNKVLRVGLMVLAVLILCALLLSLVGYPMVRVGP